MNVIDPSDMIGKDPPLAESPEAFVVKLLHVGLKVVLVLSMVIEVTLPGHQTSCKMDGEHVYDSRCQGLFQDFGGWG